ncbi:MAG: sulfite exporter TauE/SafE family protein [Prevotellaceae bacterium]|jgi:uncharacterized membrane protein YfcA|nr:sulfite exporter TauE/SafE family protein [Prevotellaceae bacterium]
MEIAILIVGIFTGILSGMFGIGGGIVMVPVLIAVCGLGMLDAYASSLAAMLLPVGILGVINYYKAGFINVKHALWIAVGMFVGSFFGAKVAVSIDISWLSKLYALFLLYVIIQFLNIPQLIFGKKKKETLHSPFPTVHYPLWQFLVVGLFAGVIAGMFGKGGGIIVVPALVKLFNYDTRAATATSLAALQLPTGLPSVIVYAQDGHLNYLYATLLAVGIVIGAFFGSKWALKLSGVIFKRIYAVFLVGAAGYMVLKYL